MDCVSIDFGHSRGIINRNIYGHFAEHIGGVIYDGLYVGEDSKVENIRGFRKSLVDSFKKINPPVVRWPGGCFAEIYNWRDGIGPKANRPRRVNWWYYCDGRVESNQVGTHEFMEFVRMVGAEPYFAANMTGTTPLHIRDWIEYCNFSAGLTTLADERAANGDAAPFGVRYWGIGNENWGGGGQMSPEMCAREYVKYTTICRSLGVKDLRFIMCGANGHDVWWTRRLMQEWQKRPWQEVPTYGMSVHYYTNWLSGQDDLNFTEEGWYDELRRADYMRNIIDDHRSAMDEFDPERKIKLIVDEWGNWHKEGTGPSGGKNLFEQQSNMRDALVCALTLNIFNNRCDVVDMANIAQLCNNLHSLYLTEGEHFVETPNYFVFDFFKTHQDAKQLPTIVHSALREKAGAAPMESLSASASVKDGVMTLTLANLSLTESKDVSLKGLQGQVQGTGEMRVLCAADPATVNTFDNPTAIAPVCNAITLRDGDSVHVPAAAVVSITLRLA